MQRAVGRHVGQGRGSAEQRRLGGRQLRAVGLEPVHDGAGLVAHRRRHERQRPVGVHGLVEIPVQILRAGPHLLHGAPQRRADVLRVHRLAERRRGVLCGPELPVAGVGEALDELRMGVVAVALRLCLVVRRALDPVGRAVGEAGARPVGEVGAGLDPVGGALRQAGLLVGREALPGRADARHGVGVGGVEAVLGRLRRGVDGVHARRDHLPGAEHVGALLTGLQRRDLSVGLRPVDAVEGLPAVALAAHRDAGRGAGVVDVAGILLRLVEPRVVPDRARQRARGVRHLGSIGRARRPGLEGGRVARLAQDLVRHRGFPTRLQRGADDGGGVQQRGATSHRGDELRASPNAGPDSLTGSGDDEARGEAGQRAPGGVHGPL